MAKPQYNFVDSIHSSNGEFYWRSDCEWKIASHYETKKIFHDILLWQCPGNLCRFNRFRSIRQMENFIDDPTSGVVDGKITSHTLAYLCRFDWFVWIVKWSMFFLRSSRQICLFWKSSIKCHCFEAFSCWAAYTGWLYRLRISFISFDVLSPFARVFWQKYICLMILLVDMVFVY